MPPTASKTKSNRKGKAAKARRKVTPHQTRTVLDETGRATHVLVPIDEYEQLVKSQMAATASTAIDDRTSKWIDADTVALKLAGQRIARARQAAGLTQKQLGAKLGIPQSQVSRIERHPDHTTVRTLRRIAKALNVDIRALV